MIHNRKFSVTWKDDSDAELPVACAGILAALWYKCLEDYVSASAVFEIEIMLLFIFNALFDRSENKVLFVLYSQDFAMYVILKDIIGSGNKLQAIILTVSNII